MNEDFVLFNEDDDPTFISVSDEDGNEFELEQIATVGLNGITYYVMYPAVEEDEETGEPIEIDADDEEFGLIIMKIIQENGEDILSTTDSEEEEEAVYNLFMEHLYEDDES